MLIFLSLLCGCADLFPSSDSKHNAPVGPSYPQLIEYQYDLPYSFRARLNFKDVYIGVKDQYSGCLPVGCSLGGIGKWTNIVYNTQNCTMDTRLVKNYRMNYYYLEITIPSAPITGYAGVDQSVSNPNECNELIGNYWVHHDGLDADNLYKPATWLKFGDQIPAPVAPYNEHTSINVDVFIKN